MLTKVSQVLHSFFVVCEINRLCGNLNHNRNTQKLYHQVWNRDQNEIRNNWSNCGLLVRYFTTFLLFSLKCPHNKRRFTISVILYLNICLQLATQDLRIHEISRVPKSCVKSNSWNLIVEQNNSKKQGYGWSRVWHCPLLMQWFHILIHKLSHELIYDQKCIRQL